MSSKDIIQDVYSLIENEFSPLLTYHGIHHTKDVHNVCKAYIAYYKINGKEAELLEIGAVAHDLGFIHTYRNHEEMSAKMIAKIMKGYRYSEKDIKAVTDMVLATKVPQKPKNFLSQIICDADLDYLGRDDFKLISLTLYQEWKNYNIFENLDEEFNNIQIAFLKNHTFHTEYANKHRKPIMLKHLKSLQNKVLKKAKI